jgi:ABC-type multidrug transport system ATPase subunit/ABC-type multidrug transport system permease subunit
MSEEILKALMELFALIVKQDRGMISYERDYVLRFLKKQLSKESVNEYLELFDELAGPEGQNDPDKKNAPPSVKDSVKILGICKKINYTLNHEQKVIVVVRLYELVNADHRFTSQRMNIINTVAEVFKISSDELTAIEQFVKSSHPSEVNNPSIMVLNPENERCESFKKILAGYQNINIFVLRIASVNLYFLKYLSEEQLYLNGLPISSGLVYTFAKGGSVKSAQGLSIYYSDISACFLSEIIIHKLSLVVENLSYNFIEGHRAINDISFSIDEGKLMGIMGASGSGKTTLLNLLSGILKPSDGSIRINGLDVNKNSSELEGVLGYVPQDDLLIEDLTVFENLYYAACQCFNDKNKQEITSLVDQTLLNLGLYEKRDFKVGSPLNKVISGGQRKRLNIALELIREPSVLFLDEPTSGLSSRDSENLMDLLRDLTLKGKLVITVIHQPSSGIFKMFDKIAILDQDGFMVFYGNPVDAVIYFKTLDDQINASQGECPSCGNVNTEIIFDIIESRVVGEFGKYTDKRKVRPEEWAEIYNRNHPPIAVAEVKEAPHKNLQRPGLLKQFLIYFTRDIKSKWANYQYVSLTLLEAPILGFILSYIIKYIVDPDSDIYIFSENENLPIYIFMSLIVALFLGLTMSAEEIFRDKKILKREHFLNLSRTSYLASKISIMIIISAIQCALFLLIANHILGIKGMFLRYWLALFTTAFSANMIGLNISAALNSAITIYIVIPLSIIPMMVLSGAMFPFDKLNRQIGSVEKVPVIAELMPTRWTYEALMVSQFKDNRFSQVKYTKEGETFYSLQKKISEADFNKVYRIPELKKALKAALEEYQKNPKTVETEDNNNASSRFNNLKLIQNELLTISQVYNLPPFKYPNSLTSYEFNPVVADSVYSYLNMVDDHFSKVSIKASDAKDRFYILNKNSLDKMRDDYFNYKLEETVTKYYERNKILFHNNRLVQNTDPVYLDPQKKGFFRFRTHFYAPSKYIFGIKMDTFTFNILLVLLSNIFWYLILYYDLLAKFVQLIEKFKLRRKLFQRIKFNFLIFVLIIPIV